MLVTIDLAPAPASVREARRFTVDTLRKWGREDLTTNGALLVTELVTNAILHARTTVQVCLEQRADVVRVEVRDGSPIRPAVRDHGLDATTGRGLSLVTQLAETWGVDVTPGGKVVWAQIAEDAEELAPDKLYLVPDQDVTDPDFSGAGLPRATTEHYGDAHTDDGSMLGRCA